MMTMSKLFRPWAFWRRMQYIISLALVLFTVIIVVYFNSFYSTPTCFDGDENAAEKGVDCGGACVRICTADVLPPQVVWAKSFEITRGQYNAVAYVENPNQVASTPELDYTFELFDSSGNVIARKSGKTVLPPNSVYPIFEGRVFTEGSEKVADTKITLKPADMWIPASTGRDQFRAADIVLTGADVRPRLNVKVENTALTAAESIEVVATIFSSGNTPVTASQTFIEKIDERSAADIVFTWPNSIAKTVRSCTIPTDVALAIDLSGSMNNDGGDPPQPVTAALQAASRFVSELKNGDQVSVVSFATEADLLQGLSKSHSSVANKILGLKIDERSEAGFTNTGAALLTAQTELNSAAHDPDARRVLVILTDGLPTAENDRDVVTETIETAKQISEDGVEIYAIGLGSGVDKSFIENIASSPSNAYFAPSGDDLDRIYTEVTSSLCEVGATKIDIIAKTKTNFTPLR